MKYRIKITTFKSGRETFESQAKILFGWAPLDFNGKAQNYKLPSDSRSEALQRIDKHFNGNTKKHTITFEYIKKE